MSDSAAPDRLPLTSPDLAADRLARLRELLPGAFAEGKLVPQKLAELVGAAAVSTAPERYGLSYTGRAEALRETLAPSHGTLRPDAAASVAWDGSQVEVREVAGQPVHLLAVVALAICLGRALTRELLRAVVALAPKRVLCLDVGFHGNDELKTNTVLEMKSHGIQFQTV